MRLYVVTFGCRANQYDSEAARALLRIQDGCDEHCTFCATTLARGANRSRPVDELVRDAERLSEWHSEIVITGVHIGTYGADIGTSLSALVDRLGRHWYTAASYAAAVERIVRDAPIFGLGKVRLEYSAGEIVATPIAAAR